MKITGVLKKIKPLFFDSRGRLVVSKANKVYLKEVDGTTQFLFKFNESVFNKIFGKLSLYFRLKRLGVMTGISSKNDYFFTYGKKIHRYNTICKGVFEEFTFSHGRGPLQFCEIENIEGFVDSVCFGEYFGNHQRNPVKIYQRTDNGHWESCFQFNEGEINHIHALIPDIHNQCVWILAGDFEHSAAIYMAKNNFNNVDLVVSGHQNYRACVAFPTSQGLLYATDTQRENNSVRLLKNNDDHWTSIKLFDLSGSCIYGCELKDYYVFSTSTEPNEDPKNIILSLLDNKPGVGIKHNASDIVIYNKQKSDFVILTTKAKDIYPYRLFQFGTIMFPVGKQSANTLYAYNVGSKTNDISTEIYEI